MKPGKTNLVRYIPILLGALVAHGQSSTQPNSDDEPTIELSPFTISADEDSGYFGSAALSGSRLKTDLKDVAASITVLTNELMDDLGTIDVAGAMGFISGGENDATYHQENVAALGGSNGYVGGDFGDNNNRRGEIRVRGLGRASQTINFIEVVGSTDRYNLERTEFLRGANSVLFGLAEPAGLVNSSTKTARLRSDFTRVELKVDNYGTRRGVLDINQSLIDDKFAVRVVGLYNHLKYRVDTAFQKDERLFLTATYKPFKNTTIRAYYETQDSNGRRPNYRTVQDNVSDWLNAYNTYAPKMTQDQIDAAFFWDPLVPSTNGVAPASVFTLSDGMAVDLGFIRRPLDTRANGTALIYSGDGQWLDPIDDVVTLLGTRTITGGNPNPPSIRRQFMRSGSARENDPSFRVDPQVTDQSIFPYEKVEIMALPGAYRRENDDRAYFTVEQRINKDFNISASFQRETYDEEQYFPVLTQTNQISVDINKNLPDGRANPNFLRPFIYGRNIAEYNDAKVTNFLFQANYDFDFAQKTDRLKWLGFHRLTGLYTYTKADRFGYRWHYMFDSDIPGVLPAANNNATSANRWIMQLWYVGDPVQLCDKGLRFTEFPKTLAAQWDRSYDYLFYNNTKNPAVWEIAPQQISTSRQLVTGGRNYTIQKNKGFGLSLQSYFWDRRIITLLGWRRDSVDAFQGVLPPISLAEFPRVPGVSRDDYLEQGNVFEDEQDTTTQSIVFNVTNNLRLFANRSENFAATAPRQDNLYRQLGPANGDTKEYGFGLNFFNRKLDLRATYFESSQNDATSSTGVAGIRVVAFEDALYNALEQAGRLDEWYTISPLGERTTERYERPNNAATTEDRISKGYSVEASWRPTNNWDFLIGFDKLDTKVANVGRELMDFLDARADFYGKYFAEGLRTDGTTDPNSSSTLLETRFVDTIAQNYVNEIRGEGISNRGVADYTAKLVGRYRFTEGRLKGLSIGANLRWESGKVLGYGEVPATFNFGGLQNYPGMVADVTKEYVGDSIIAGGMMLSYSFNLSDRIKWRIQFNAQNIFNSERGLRVFAANPDGSPIWAMAQPRVYELTNTFEF